MEKPQDLLLIICLSSNAGRLKNVNMLIIVLSNKNIDVYYKWLYLISNLYIFRLELNTNPQSSSPNDMENKKVHNKSFFYLVLPT